MGKLTSILLKPTMTEGVYRVWKHCKEEGKQSVELYRYLLDTDKLDAVEYDHVRQAHKFIVNERTYYVGHETCMAVRKNNGRWVRRAIALKKKILRGLKYYEERKG